MIQGEVTADPSPAPTPPPPAASGTPLLQLERVSKRFGAVQALTEVDFEVHGGEVVALVGDNGAGKSTLTKTIAGSIRADTGRIVFDGQPVRIHKPSDATALGIATVYQDLALCDNLDVVANLYLGREAMGLGLDEIVMETTSNDLLQRLSVKIPSVRTPVASLSGGQRQSIAVARAAMGAPRVVLLDEPTAALGVAQTAEVLELIRALRAEGLGVVVISHSLNDVFAVSDRIVVLRLGHRVAEFRTAEATTDAVVSAITGADVHLPHEERA
jgi:D-xylose transport system ATP-binding protein